MMTFYHGTSEEEWEAIQTEGDLWGVRNAPSRCTYLAVSRDHAADFGPVVLEVLYDYEDGHRRKECNYWDEECWQFRVYEPIPLSQVTRLI